MDKLKNLIIYGIGGAATTVVNYAVYFILCYLGVNYLGANAAAWILAVLFSYWINRKMVFRSDNIWYKELFTFCSLRFATLMAETLLLFLAVDCLHISSAVSKITVSIVTVLANYTICQKKVFTKGVEQHD